MPSEIEWIKSYFIHFLIDDIIHILKLMDNDSQSYWHNFQQLDISQIMNLSGSSYHRQPQKGPSELHNNQLASEPNWFLQHEPSNSVAIAASFKQLHPHLNQHPLQHKQHKKQPFISQTDSKTPTEERIDVELQESTRNLRAEDKKEKKDKGDGRNLYPSFMKKTLKALVNPQNQKAVRRIWSTIEVASPDQYYQMIKFFQKRKSREHSLKDIYYFMNYDEGDPTQRIFKELFYKFTILHMRRDYALSVVTSSQCEFKQLYLRDKNTLIYLPKVKSEQEKASKKNRKNPRLKGNKKESLKDGSLKDIPIEGQKQSEKDRKI